MKRKPLKTWSSDCFKEAEGNISALRDRMIEEINQQENRNLAQLNEERGKRVAAERSIKILQKKITIEKRANTDL